MSILRKILGSLFLGIAAICLGLYLFNYAFEKHEVREEDRQEEFVHDQVDNKTLTNLFDWSQEDNARDREVRKIALMVIGVGTATTGIVVFPKKKLRS